MCLTAARALAAARSSSKGGVGRPAGPLASCRWAGLLRCLAGSVCAGRPACEEAQGLGGGRPGFGGESDKGLSRIPGQLEALARERQVPDDPVPKPLGPAGVPADVLPRPQGAEALAVRQLAEQLVETAVG